MATRSDMGLEELAGARIREAAATYEQLAREPYLGSIVAAARVITAAYRHGGKLLLFGNGGSAADAQHIAGEFLGRFVRDREPLPAVALADGSAALTAIANDYSYHEVFARQVRALGQAGDVALGISTSGDSENVIAGMLAARDAELATIALSGRTGGALPMLADICIRVPAASTPRVQEGHALAGHLLCELVERELFGRTA
jgi:D-sedoheptulose 7-phosphate isomerase